MTNITSNKLGQCVEYSSEIADDIFNIIGVELPVIINNCYGTKLLFNKIKDETTFFIIVTTEDERDKFKYRWINNK